MGIIRAIAKFENQEAESSVLSRLKQLDKQRFDRVLIEYNKRAKPRGKIKKLVSQIEVLKAELRKLENEKTLLLKQQG